MRAFSASSAQCAALNQTYVLYSFVSRGVLASNDVATGRGRGMINQRE